MQTLESVVAQHPFFAGLSSHWLHQIAACAYNRHFNAGEHIFREGEEARQVFLLREGEVAVEMCHPQRGPILVQTLGAGEVLGWSWLCPPYFWLFDARAIRWTRTIALDGEGLRALCDADHDLGYELMKRFAVILLQRLQSTRLNCLMGSGGPSKERGGLKKVP